MYNNVVSEDIQDQFKDKMYDSRKKIAEKIRHQLRYYKRKIKIIKITRLIIVVKTFRGKNFTIA